MTVQCFECYVARTLTTLAACPRHATDEEKAEAHRRILKLADQPHPLLEKMRKR
jgi:hypothetical protein